MGNLYELLEICFILNMIIIDVPGFFGVFFVEILLGKSRGHLFRNCWDLMGILALKTPKIYLMFVELSMFYRRFHKKKHGDVGPKH